VFRDGAEILRTGAIEIATDVKDAMLGALVESDQAKAFFAELKSVHDDLSAAVALARRAAAMLGIGHAITTNATRRDVPEAFDVDLDDLENTFLDLKRVPAQRGDVIEVTATLKQPGKDEKSFTTSFKTTHYGWHARLSPGVVLVRPDQLSGRSNKFRFAPTLAWIHRYSPRPSKGQTVLESLQPGVGIHAAFLDFDADSEVQIGLGATVSFWEDRLQFGAGYNLMADSDNDGRIYYFVGSDLIGLLQTIGLAK
ncbi:MAG: hypothetical protein OER88_12225, partial [Planctomycetota bacterium]|nr:hypothetical protein [Planctomycetota bacterium]